MHAQHRSRTRQDAIADFRREQIVDAAQKVIGKLGYDDASVDRIAEEAHIAKSTLYVYFDSKEAILKHCFGVGYSQLTKRLRDGIAGARTVEGQLKAMVQGTLEHVDENLAFFRAVTAVPMDGTPDDPLGSPALLAQQDDYRSMLESILRAGVASGDLRAHDVRQSTDVVGTLVCGAIALRARGERTEVPERVAKRLVGIFLRGVASPRP